MSSLVDFLNICVTGTAPAESNCKILLVGQMTEGSATPNKVVQVIPGTEDAVFGANSILADMVRKADCACSSGIYAVPLVGVGSAAVYDLPIVVTTNDGLVAEPCSITISGIDTTFTAVAMVGDDAAAVALSIADAINDNDQFQYTAVAGAAGVTLTADNLGEIGNQLAFDISECADLTIGGEVLTTPGAGVPDSTEAIECLGECCYDCVAYQGFDAVNVDAWKAYAKKTFACDAPIQCFTQIYTAYVADTAAEHVLAMNELDCRSQYYIPIKSEHLEILGYTSWHFAATLAALNCCKCCNEAARPVVRDNGILGCLVGESDCQKGGLWTRDEREALACAGAVVWDASPNGSLWVLLNQTTYKTNDQGQPDTFWQTASARCVVKDFQQGLIENYTTRYSSVALFNDGTIIPAGTSGVTPNIINNETIAYLENEVGLTIDSDNFSDLVQTQRDPNNPNRVIQCINRASIANALLQIEAKVQLIA